VVQSFTVLTAFAHPKRGQILVVNSRNKVGDGRHGLNVNGATVFAGQLVTAVWVVIPRLAFANSCLATVFYSVGMVMVAQNGHIGSRLKAMVVIPGAWWVGSVCGGFTVSTPQHASHGFTLAQLTLLHCMYISKIHFKSKALSAPQAWRWTWQPAKTSVLLSIMHNRQPPQMH